MKIEKWSKEAAEEKGITAWWILLIAFVFTAVCTALAMITKNSLYVNLSPYMAICFIALGVEALIHTVVNIGRLQGWGFNLLPAALCILFGILMLVFKMMEDRILAFYVGYGFLSAAMLLISYGFSMKGYGGYFWIPAFSAGIVAGIPALMLLFFPLHQTLSILRWTQIGFLVLALCMLILVVSIFLLQRELKKKNRRVAVRGRSFL